MERFDGALQGDHDTSRYAHADSNEPERAADRKARILDYVRDRGWYGAIVNGEITEATGIPNESCAPTVAQLTKTGWLRDSGLRRPSVNGCESIVWVVVPAEQRKESQSKQTRFKVALANAAYKELLLLAGEWDKTPQSAAEKILRDTLIDYYNRRTGENHD